MKFFENWNICRSNWTYIHICMRNVARDKHEFTTELCYGWDRENKIWNTVVKWSQEWENWLRRKNISVVILSLLISMCFQSGTRGIQRWVFRPSQWVEMQTKGMNENDFGIGPWKWMGCNLDHVPHAFVRFSSCEKQRGLGKEDVFDADWQTLIPFAVDLLTPRYGCLRFV